uniref:Peroxidase n=1 Tax=Noccaea caerulescens TaxID=107243 RepID=A0A1J3DS85_NOCCA
MGASKLLVVSCLLFVLFLAQVNAQGLKVGFYGKTCPQAEGIVRKVVFAAMKKAPTLGAPLLRMFFHDCFVRGCDGSILLDLPKNQTEKNAVPNLSLRGFGIIDDSKAAIEKVCPGIVSCSDILALITRDAMVALEGPSWEVETGRRDGRVSNINEVNLPTPFDNITKLITEFRSKGLNEKDLVVLSGGHTIGMGHCPLMTNRLYNFTGRGDSDPSLDSEYAANLRRKCKPTDTTTALEMDPGSFKTFDVSYFTLVAKRRGLFQSDAALLDNSKTRAYVLQQARTHGSTFFYDFGVSMVKMGRIGVLTGRAGEIRKVCSVAN